MYEEATYLCSRDEFCEERLRCLFEAIQEKSERTCAVAQIEELLEEEERVRAGVGVGGRHDCAGANGWRLSRFR